MTRTGIVLALALVVGACGSSEKSKCEGITKRVVACDPDLAKDKAAGPSAIEDEMISDACKDDEMRAITMKLDACMPQSSCEAFNACVEKLTAAME